MLGMMAMTGKCPNRLLVLAGARNACELVCPDVAAPAGAAREAPLIEVGPQQTVAQVGHDRNVGASRAARLIGVGERRSAIVRKREQERIYL